MLPIHVILSLNQRSTSLEWVWFYFSGGWVISLVNGGVYKYLWGIDYKSRYVWKRYVRHKVLLCEKAILNTWKIGDGAWCNLHDIHLKKVLKLFFKPQKAQQYLTALNWGGCPNDKESGSSANPQIAWGSITLLWEAQTMNGYIVLLRDDWGPRRCQRDQDTLYFPIKDRRQWHHSYPMITITLKCL